MPTETNFRGRRASTIENDHMRVTVLHEGRILAQGRLAEIRLDDRVLDVYLGRTFRASGN